MDTKEWKAGFYEAYKKAMTGGGGGVGTFDSRHRELERFVDRLLTQVRQEERVEVVQRWDVLKKLTENEMITENMTNQLFAFDTFVQKLEATLPTEGEKPTV